MSNYESSLGALCSDFYINQKIELKLDLPDRRETILEVCDRIRRELPSMDRIRRFDDEYALESSLSEDDSQYCWMAMRRTSIRSGWVNPQSLDDAYRLHRLLLEIAPYYLSITPLDVEYIELIFGFDLLAESDRNEVVFEALLSKSHLAGLIDHSRERLTDVQPFIGLRLNQTGSLKAFVEVRTHTNASDPSSACGMSELTAPGGAGGEPISVYLTVRQDGPLKSMDDFKTVFGSLAGHTERLAEDRVLPNIIIPLRETLLSRPG